MTRGGPRCCEVFARCYEMLQSDTRCCEVRDVPRCCEVRGVARCLLGVTRCCKVLRDVARCCEI